jgi:hypothetical protein
MACTGGGYFARDIALLLMLAWPRINRNLLLFDLRPRSKVFALDPILWSGGMRIPLTAEQAQLNPKTRSRIVRLP